MERICRKEFFENVYDEEMIKFLINIPHVILFFKKNCKSSKYMNTRINVLTADTTILTYKIDIDENEEVCNIFGITDSATVLYIDEIGNVDISIGEKSEEVVKSHLSDIIIKKETKCQQ